MSILLQKSGDISVRLSNQPSSIRPSVVAEGGREGGPRGRKGNLELP